MIVVDTSGVLAAKDEDQPQHAAVARTLTATTEDLLLSPLVFAECDYILATRLAAADASLVVVAARFQTTRILTLDERHFRTLPPLWGAAAFTLLPADS